MPLAVRSSEGVGVVAFMLLQSEEKTCAMFPGNCLPRQPSERTLKRPEQVEGGIGP